MPEPYYANSKFENKSIRAWFFMPIFNVNSKF